MEIVEPGPDHGRVAGDGDGDTEEVGCAPVGGEQLGLLGPGRAVTSENVGRALLGVGSGGVSLCTKDNRVTGHRRGTSEFVPSRPISDDQVRLLDPIRARP